MDNKQKNKGTLTIVNKHPNILPIAKDVKEGITQISAQIETDKIDFNNNLRKLEENNTVEIERNWLGMVKKKSVEEAITYVHSDLRDFAKYSAKAFGSLSNNVSGILQLLQLITTIEHDLYTIIDDQSIASNELRSLIQEWCRENNIKDEDVEKLLNTTIQRAYTLRDRIENLRNDCNQKIEQTAEELEDLKQRITEFEKEFDEKSKALDSQVETAIQDVEKKQKETSDALLQEQKENISEMEKTFKENLSRIQECTESLEKSQEAFITDSKTQEEKRVREQNQAFTSFVEENTKRYQVFKSQYEEHKETIDKEFDEKSKALESQVETAIQDVEKKQKETSDALLQEQKENISEMEKTFKENLSRIQECTESLEKSQEAFITDGKTQEEKRAQEQKQAFTSFVEENTKLSQTLKRQLNIYKAISIGATSISIASLLYVVFT